ncbi:MAG TPA: hypothetical protein VFE54_09820 [Mucilaginibacter sp.]|nr:hypothetical protein [Mucilaginibacter sp.]
MKKHTEAEQFAEEILSSLDNIKAAEIDDFLFTRIQNKLGRQQTVFREKQTVVMLRLAALLIFLFAINAISFYRFKASVPETGKQASGGLSAFAAEYKLEQNSYNY